MNIDQILEDLMSYTGDNQPKVEITSTSNVKEEANKTVCPNYLSIGIGFESKSQNLIDKSESYHHFLRTILMRGLLHTSISRYIKFNKSYSISQFYEFIGLCNVDEYAKEKDPYKVCKDLQSILDIWENELTSESLPVHLVNNMNKIAKMANLNEVEQQVLALAILFETEEILIDFGELYGSKVSSKKIPKIYAALLNLDVELVEKAFTQDSNLIKSGLIILNYCGVDEFSEIIHLVSNTFSTRALTEQENLLDLLNDLFKPAQVGLLKEHHFMHVKERYDLVKTYLKASIQMQKKGVNILIYGEPGTGKTEFAKSISNSIGIQLLEVSVADIYGAPLDPIKRLQSYDCAQKLCTQKDVFIMFDECEEILSSDAPKFSSNNKEKAQKSWINQILENNPIPVIWIANSIENFDSAYIRRFNICFEMPIPNQKQRLEMLKDLCGQSIESKMILDISKNQAATPAILNNAVQVINLISQTENKLDYDQLFLGLINDKLEAQGHNSVQSSPKKNFILPFDPHAINCSAPLISISEGVINAKEGRIFIYGPPGTGKSAYGKWLADCMSAPHHIYKASDLLGSHVGETEKNIANAFHLAKQQKAILQFDEVDTFISNRKHAKQSWEITMVNEMLTQLESYEGIFIASTNLFEQIDEAAMRRFDFIFEFGYLKTDKAFEMLQNLCNHLGVEVNPAEINNFKHLLNLLTPGDFDQVARQSRFLKPKSNKCILEKLSTIARRKKNFSKHTIGFIN